MEGWKDGRMGIWGYGYKNGEYWLFGSMFNISEKKKKKKKKKRYKIFQIHNTTQHNR